MQGSSTLAEKAKSTGQEPGESADGSIQSARNMDGATPVPTRMNSMPPPESPVSRSPRLHAPAVDTTEVPTAPPQSPDSTSNQRKLSFSSMNQAFQSQRIALDEVEGGDHPIVKKDEQQWVSKIMNAFDTTCKAKPDEIRWGKAGDRTEDDVNREWQAWQKRSQDHSGQ